MLTEEMLQESLDRNAELLDGIVQYMKRVHWDLYDNVQQLRHSIESGCRSYMMPDKGGHYSSAWRGGGLCAYLAFDSEGNTWLNIEWLGKPTERSREVYTERLGLKEFDY